MYEDNEKRINWLSILKRVIAILIVLIIIFGIITLITKCTKKIDDKKEPEQKINLSSQITDVQKATIDYLTKETLPLSLNQTKTVKLKYLINKNLIMNLKDSNGNLCDTDLSLSEITRLENNYAMKTTVVCGKNTDYSVIYIGCFENCDGKICAGNTSDGNGICTTTSEDKKQDEKTNDNKKDSSNKSTKDTTTTKKTTTTTTKPAKIMYEYKKANYNYYCTAGELVNNECRSKETWIYEGKVKETTVSNTSSYNVNANVESVSFTNPSSATNNSTTTYELVSYKNGKYNYNKYTCSNGTINGKTCTVTKTTNEVVRSCEDSSYTYNQKDNTCTKNVLVTLWRSPKYTVSYDYMWSEKESIDGWTRTGNVK